MEIVSKVLASKGLDEAHSYYKKCFTRLYDLSKSYVKVSCNDLDVMQCLAAQWKFLFRRRFKSEKLVNNLCEVLNLV